MGILRAAVKTNRITVLNIRKLYLYFVQPSSVNNVELVSMNKVDLSSMNNVDLSSMNKVDLSSMNKVELAGVLYGTF